MLACDHPLERLTTLAQGRVSGELIASSRRGETHVYLVRGRLAWATDSRRPLGFAGHLQRTAGISADTLREVADECRRGMMPLGDTLLAWGLVTAADLRLALAQQLRDALALLREDDDARALFLTREWSADDDALTFELSEVLTDDVAPAIGSATSVHQRIDGLTWVERFEGDRLVDAEPTTQGARTPAPLLHATVLDDADFVALRHARGCTIGIRGADASSLWCRLADESRIGSVLATLGITGGSPAAAPPASGPPAAWTIGNPAADATPRLRDFLARAPEAVAALLVDDDDPGPPRAGAGTSTAPPDWCASLTRRRGHALRCVETRIDLAPPSLVSDERQAWCFGARLVGDGARSVWLFLDRSSPQGLGWTYLAALTRSLASTTSA